MKVTHDDNLRANVLQGESALDMVRTARQVCEGTNRSTNYAFSEPDWLGRKLADWAELEHSFGRPWADGLATIRELRAELERIDLPTPRCRKRRARWSDVDGDVDSDRVLAGEASFYRLVQRDDLTGPTVITILCQFGGLNSVEPRDLFWRGATCAALVDILESAGYSCEIVIWSRADGCYGRGSNRPDVFRTFKLKEAGDPLDLDTLACGLSAWFYRLVMLGVCYAGGAATDGKGSTNTTLGEFRKYLDVDGGDTRLIELGACYSREQAVESSRAALAALTQPLF